ncbi:efflux RND transporter periplasmic adaptor subunit [Rheinheimera sp.]|uniref:efflux RND transporter periplasmic adaptor subunit n=1 Tax=Rheinheimera sp. TaxID=1869214 RepID=UPI004048628F
MKNIKLVFTGLLILCSLPVMAAPGAHGPDGEHLTEATPTHVNGMGRQADGSVQMPMADQQQLGIFTQFAKRSTTAQHIQLDAVVRHHPSGRALVQSSSDGRLDIGPNGLPVSGQRVKAGDVLGYIRYQDTAYELASQNSELIALRTDAEQVQRDIRRLEALGDLAPKQQLEQLQTQLQRVQQQEQLLQRGLEKPEVLLSPMSGIVHSDNISRGQWVEAGTTLFEIIDPTQLLIEASTAHVNLASDIDSAVLEHAADINLHFTGFGARLKQGQIPLYFEPVADASPSSVPLILEQPVRLRARLKQQQQGIVLPAEAVVLNKANLPVVWIKLSAERFLPQQVQYKVLDPEHVLIEQGLGEDNRVVVQGASLLNQVR